MLISHPASRHLPELEIATAFLGASRVPVQGRFSHRIESTVGQKQKRTGKRTR